MCIICKYTNEYNTCERKETLQFYLQQKFIGVVKLDCSKCDNIKEIPNINGLKKLFCSRCDNINEIPNIKSLVKLYYY